MGARPTVVLAALDAADVLARRAAPGDARRGRALVQRVEREAAQIGMDRAVARADALLACLEESPRTARRSTPAESPLRAVLRREQDVWLLEYGGRSLCLQDAKGLHHLATLFEHPGTPVAALALSVGATTGEQESPADVVPRALVEDLREELAEARAYNDPERIARAREQLELIAAGVAQADEASSAANERARVNVTRAIKAVVRRIAEQEPDLGHLLRGTVRTGTSCRYEPDPGVPLTWEVER